MFLHHLIYKTMTEIIKNISGIPHLIIENKVIDNILLADSFIFNKLEKTSWHWEWRLYVWPTSIIEDSFFWGFSYQWFFLKDDLIDFMMESKTEYLLQEQDYRRNIADLYEELLWTILNLPEWKLYFQIESAQWKNDEKRYYIRSQWNIWEFMRRIALPNLSYISIMQVLSPNNNIELYFRLFMSYEYNSMNHPKLIEKEEAEIAKWVELNGRQSSLKQARIWQGEYRRKLLEQMPFCPITMVSDERFLIASHIKPWAKSDEKEKTDPNNGFMFTPNIDKLFDQWFISFSAESRMLISPWVSPMNRRYLWIIENKEYSHLQIRGKRVEYLSFHQESIFKK